MYKSERQQLAFTDFNQPVGLQLDPENRWIKMASHIPWAAMEKKYADLFPAKVGYPAKPFRLVMGSLIIQKIYDCPDRELVQMIRENPYLQFFCGYPGYDSSREPFNASALVGFRKRLTPEFLGDFNEMIIDLAKGLLTGSAEPDGGADDADHGSGPTGSGMSSDDSRTSLDGEQTAQPPGDDRNGPDRGANEPLTSQCAEQPNSGTLMLDGTCAPSDIRYPQDLSLLNEAREKAEGIIDRLHESTGGRKPRTYRIKAAKQYKAYIRKRRHTSRERRKAIRRQLGYLARDLRAIEELVSSGAVLSEKDEALLATLQRVYDQQKSMYDTRTHRVPDRIVSIEQPYIRPIVRGKVKDPTEFGAKIHMSISDGYARFDYVSWDAFNEGTLLQQSAEAYRQREGHYPERILADKIYRTRANLSYCREHGIRLMGPPLGRPRKNPDATREITRKDGIDRIEVERQFSLGKRCCGLGRIWTRRKETSECSLGLSLIALNLRNITRRLDLFFALRGAFSCVTPFLIHFVGLGTLPVVRRFRPSQ